MVTRLRTYAEDGRPRTMSEYFPDPDSPPLSSASSTDDVRSDYADGADNAGTRSEYEEDRGRLEKREKKKHRSLIDKTVGRAKAKVVAFFDRKEEARRIRRERREEMRKDDVIERLIQMVVDGRSLNDILAKQERDVDVMYPASKRAKHPEQTEMWEAEMTWRRNVARIMCGYRAERREEKRREEEEKEEMRAAAMRAGEQMQEKQFWQTYNRQREEQLYREELEEEERQRLLGQWKAPEHDDDD